jgi:hypothetical protein
MNALRLRFKDQLVRAPTMEVMLMHSGKIGLDVSKQLLAMEQWC